MELETMEMPELRRAFQDVFGYETKCDRADAIRRRLAYRIQEIEFGGLDKQDEEALKRIADNDPAEFKRACIDRPKDETLPDQWTSQIFARILAHHPVIMVTDLCDHQMLKDMHMTPVNTLEEALKLAFEMKGADAKVAVIPDGLGVVVAQH